MTTTEQIAQLEDEKSSLNVRVAALEKEAAEHLKSLEGAKDELKKAADALAASAAQVQSCHKLFRAITAVMDAAGWRF